MHKADKAGFIGHLLETLGDETANVLETADSVWALLQTEKIPVEPGR